VTFSIIAGNTVATHGESIVCPWGKTRKSMLTDRVITEEEVWRRLFVESREAMQRRSLSGWLVRMWRALGGVHSPHTKERDRDLIRWAYNIEMYGEPPRFYPAALRAVGVVHIDGRYREVGDE
jgi:hypothetical protein